MDEPKIPHPLDQDLDAPLPELPRSLDRAPAYKPLLMPSIYIAIGSAAVVAIAKAMEGNLATYSSAALPAAIIAKVAMSIMLAACCGIFAAYQIHRVKQRAALDLGAVFRSSGWYLLVGNACFLALAWISPFVPYWGIGVALPTLLVTLPVGLLVTMIVFNRGAIRAYAIGALTGASLQLPVLSAFIFSSPGSGRIGTPWFYQYAAPLGLTLAVVSGLVCAIYVALLTAFRNAERSRNQAAASNDLPTDGESDLETASPSNDG